MMRTEPSVAPYRSAQPESHDGFAALVRAEWTKLRSVRGWLIALVAGAVLIVALAVLNGEGSHSGFCTGGRNGQAPHCVVGHPPEPTGPGGEVIVDTYELVHQPLTGNGSITARLTSFTGIVGNSGPVQVGQALADSHPGLAGWSKGGIIITDSTRQGAPYAAVMQTGGHGVHMQYDFTHDLAGSATQASPASPRWLRLTRSGDTITGYESADGTHWTTIGAATLPGLPATVQAGIFTTSPMLDISTQHLVVTTGSEAATQATAVFDSVSLDGGQPAGTWTGDDVGEDPRAGPSGLNSYEQGAGTFTLTGAGDIAPAPDAAGTRGIEASLNGAFVALIVFLVLGTLFVTSEYRRGLVRTTLAATPRRGRVLAAKAVVLGVSTFVISLAGIAVALPVGEKLLRGNGNFVAHVSTPTLIRVVVGTAAVLAVSAIVALGIGTVLRRSAGAITAAIVGLLLPIILATSGLPTGASEWLLRLTPAASFAVQQTAVVYPMVSFPHTPANGYFPLPAWAGFLVLCAWAAVALGVATYLLNRRDV
ncbi:MAG TPA: ABC transporter permease subunit [Actinomycetota bacterium]|nr:ABC transporter permease subunit [Actinomycetota bacterium]